MTAIKAIYLSHDRRISTPMRGQERRSQDSWRFASLRRAPVTRMTQGSPPRPAARGRRGCRSPGRSRRSRPDRGRRSRCPGGKLRASSGAWMCWTIQPSAPSWAQAEQIDHPLERPARGPHPLDRRNLRLDGQDRLDLQRRAKPRLRAADPPTASQVLERVDREPDFSSARARRARSATAAPSPPSRAAAAAASTTVPDRRMRSGVDHVTRPPSRPGCRAPGRPRDRAGHPARQMDRDNARPASAAARTSRGSRRPTAATWSAAPRPNRAAE